jgi:hypothetical protein
MKERAADAVAFYIHLSKVRLSGDRGDADRRLANATNEGHIECVRETMLWITVEGDAIAEFLL